MGFPPKFTGSTISTLLHDRINPKDCQVLSLGDTGFLQFFRVVSRDDKANPGLAVGPFSSGEVASWKMILFLWGGW